MTLEVSIEADLDEAIKYLTSLEREQVPFATALALTRVAKNAQSAVIEEMKDVFDRPTPFTLNSTYVKPATKQQLRAEVGIKGQAVKAVPAIKWLAPQIYGGGRSMKRFEALLQSRGMMPAGLYAVPASGARMDAYGNMSRGQIVAILSALGAARDPLANRPKGKGTRRRRRRGGDYFAVVQKTGRLKPGVYERIGFGFGSSVRPVLAFVHSPYYHKRLPFYEVIERTIAAEFQGQFALALNYALGTATLVPTQLAA